ncbi:MAG TPA: tRNA (adenosine(37)-N6)-threonylcarbamoyltransferase complex transferase subunit TsaD [candidate division Zixibacteria bacterium]|nr:tRNA (adenosine(37)-N6)-threonylcarbamoyltransferase complex transferase subunit TsaD [candidate division Zixibacteria bacterium]
MLTLGIESSCDETSLAVIRDGRDILSNIILGQMIHSEYGGVVPELASREHMKAIISVYHEALKTAGINPDDIDLYAATYGPGLVGALLVGLNFGKALAYGKNRPFVAVNHLEGHIAANFLIYENLPTRHLTLVISGGHTLLALVNGFGNYQILGQTKDDAVGEAYDKVAKLLGLGYPGGREIDRLAGKGDKKYFRFPRGMIKDESLDFSYSGLKTAVALHVRSLTEKDLRKHLADIAASFQEAAVEVLVEKTIRAAKKLDIRDISLSGGVASNNRLKELMEKNLAKIGGSFYCPPPGLCTDNGAMIAAAGYRRYKLTGPSDLDINAVPYLRLE